MSYFLDPPALFILGMMVYYVGKRFRWRLRTTIIIELLIAFGPFMLGSTLLYLDLWDWPLPLTEGPVWMFHTNYTGIDKSIVPVSLAAFMLIIYPMWILLGDMFARKLDIGFLHLRDLSYQDVKSHKKIVETKFAVRRGTSPEQITSEAVNAIGGMGRYVKQGDKVMVKINICGGNHEIKGSYTSQEVVGEIIKMIREVGGEPFLVDSDMIWTKFEPAAQEENWYQWTLQKNIPLRNLNKTKWGLFNFGKDSSIGRVPVSMEAINADVIISIPTMKTHLLTDVTLGMKNMYGTFPEENKAKFHRFKIEDVIYEVNKAFTPNLTVIDGTIGGEAWGPLSSTPLNFQTIIASNDVVAADAVACQLMGYNPLEIDHIKMAHDKELGDGSVKFDLSTLPYTHEKDGKWVRPEPLLTDFYEELIEAFLLLPGAQNLFDLAADYVLKAGSVERERLMKMLPILRETTKVEIVLNDALGGLFRSGYRVVKGTAADPEQIRKYLEDFQRRMETEGGHAF